MKRMRCLLWFLSALCAVCLSVVVNWQEREDMPAQSCQPRAESSVTTPQRQWPHEATLTDASHLYRICSSRPQRILPTHGSRTTRTVTPTSHLVRQHIVKHLHSFHDSRCRMESAPYCLSALCDYYVIALRHIIR